MNALIVRIAYRARTWPVIGPGSRPRTGRRAAVILPLPLVAWLWPAVGRMAHSPMRWATYRWPLNGARWLAAHTWSKRWTGHQHPACYDAARFVWTGLAIVVELVALALALILTALALPVWLVANMVGAALIVIGWTPPLAAEGLDPSRLAEWAASVTDDLIEPPLDPPTIGGSVAGPTDSADWNNAHDPVLAAQREATAELRRHNDLLQGAQRQQAQGAETTRRPAGGSAAPPAVSGGRRGRHGQPPTRRPWGAWLAGGVAGLALLVTVGVIAGALMLSIAASWNRDAVPPTVAEIEAGIHQRTSERQADIESRYDLDDSAEPEGTGP